MSDRYWIGDEPFVSTETHWIIAVDNKRIKKTNELRIQTNLTSICGRYVCRIKPKKEVVTCTECKTLRKAKERLLK